jgi:2-methylisocitrate lyase-like PEP mutase family enzyme
MLANAAVRARRATFRDLHQSGCFVIPNPWDVGSARYLRHLGFKALATTSSGFAFKQGRADGTMGVDSVITHVREIVGATDLPVNADFESGYAADPDGVASNVLRCIATGAAGLSIEDSTGDDARPLYDLDVAVARLRAARRAIDETGGEVLLTARAECYLVGHDDPLRESLRRLEAYAKAGADVLYAPGPRSREDIAAIVEAAAGLPVNVLMSANTGLKVPDLAALGVRRISVGSALSRAAWTGFIQAATTISAEGSFAAFETLIPFAELQEFFKRPEPKP